MSENDVYRTIIQEIQNSNHKAIPFREFMELALYAKNGGYYNRETKKIGRQGDFYTNSSVGAVYGETLADAVRGMLIHANIAEKRYIVEMGGGDGSLSFHLLSRLQATGDVFDSTLGYIMIEASAYHRTIQQEKLAPFQGQIPIVWYETIEEARSYMPQLHGVFISNELPDAFPVHLIERKNGKWREVYVALNEKNEFVEELEDSLEQELIQYIVEERIPEIEGYRTEVNLASVGWMEEVGRWIAKGYVVTVDYGYERELLYAPNRKQGTLLCYCGHMVSDNPYLHPGEQDITAHVNFSALADAGVRQGMITFGFYSQREFLLRAGILERLQEHASVDPFLNENARRNRAIRQLIMPDGMGDTFRVLIQGKGMDGEERHRLFES